MYRIPRLIKILSNMSATSTDDRSQGTVEASTADYCTDDTLTDDRLADDRGQGTVEYVLVMLAAAAMASALIAWIGRTSLIPSFFSAVLRFVTGSVG